MRRILYVLEDYPVTSETYVEAEIEYFLGKGIEIAAWSRRQDPLRGVGQVPVFTKSIQEAVQTFRPQGIHVHWLPIAPSALTAGVGLPVTVRAHSFEFNASVVRSYADHASVAAVFLFPHLARSIGSSEKIIPLPCAYSERLFYPREKELGTVVRATAGLGTKDIDSFLDAARACPEARFTLITSRPKENDSYLNNLIGRNAAMGVPAMILVEVPREEAAEIVGRSQICLRSNNPSGHPFGMPISIAEAMASGTIPVVRDHDPAREYVGDAGLYFQNVWESVDRIRQILGDGQLASRLRAASIERAKRYAASAVLPKILEVWERSCGW
jgi:glycosyltransferase involved in cell wall biosynthesis